MCVVDLGGLFFFLLNIKFDVIVMNGNGIVNGNGV